MMAKRPTKNQQDKEPGPVGPGKPPVEHRFQKGVSGNPKGRPKKERDMRSLVEAELDEFVSVTRNGKQVRVTKRAYIATNLVNNAAKGDEKALKLLLQLVGSGSEPENPTVQVDPAEIARFVLRHMPKQPDAGDREADGDADNAGASA